MFLFVLGMLLLCAFAVLDAFIRVRMKNIGFKWIFLRGGTFDYGDYMKVRAKHGWSGWPIYLMWTMLILGLVFLIAGCIVRFGLHPN